MSAYALDENHDIYISGGSRARVTGSEEVAQKLERVLLSYRGDWWLDLLSGVPWIQKILGDELSRGESEDLIKQTILSVVGVEGLEEFDGTFDGTNRLVSVTFRANTTSGPTGEITVDV
jgi:hypothetical protein